MRQIEQTPLWEQKYTPPISLKYFTKTLAWRVALMITSFTLRKGGNLSPATIRYTTLYFDCVLQRPFTIFICKGKATQNRDGEVQTRSLSTEYLVCCVLGRKGGEIFGLSEKNWKSEGILEETQMGKFEIRKSRQDTYTRKYKMKPRNILFYHSFNPWLCWLWQYESRKNLLMERFYDSTFDPICPPARVSIEMGQDLSLLSFRSRFMIRRQKSMSSVRSWTSSMMTHPKQTSEVKLYSFHLSNQIGFLNLYKDFLSIKKCFIIMIILVIY